MLRYLANLSVSRRLDVKTCHQKTFIVYPTFVCRLFTGPDRFYRNWYFFFSIVTTAGKFNRNDSFEVFMRFLQMLRQICYSVLLARHFVSFIITGQRNGYDFVCRIRLTSLKHSNSWSTQHFCQEKVSKV